MSCIFFKRSERKLLDLETVLAEAVEKKHLFKKASISLQTSLLPRGLLDLAREGAIPTFLLTVYCVHIHCGDLYKNIHQYNLWLERAKTNQTVVGYLLSLKISAWLYNSVTLSSLFIIQKNTSVL